MITYALKKSIVAIVFGMVVLLSLPSINDASGFTVDRISGENRYKTAVEVSKKGWTSSGTVLIAAGNQFPDALTGTPLAYSLNAPILLTQNSTLPSETKKEISRLKAKDAIILGGTNAVSNNVYNQLVEMGLKVDRISGSDRYQTSVKIAERLSGQTNTAVVVYGKNFPDSLAIAAHAAQNGYPILLTKSDSLPSETKKILSKYRNTIVVGGSGVISESQLKHMPNAKRYSGKDRYDTVAKLVNELGIKFGNEVYMATGQSYADALTGSVLAAKNKSSLVLVQKDKIPAPVQSMLDKVSASKVTIIGGTNAVSANVQNKLEGFDTVALVNTATQYIGAPYKYGGTSPSGFDCSGFIQFVFGKHGISTPRTTADLHAGGKAVSKLEVGDLVFYRTDPKKNSASHAGIYIGNNKFIHAKSAGSNIGVTIDEMSNSYFAPLYLGAKRYH
ncbi:cell wall-binding repeat-containing protein [Sutcliffiella rhizosphaerae]|uniref:NlpC/P60 domain-containing protein n=1 Tax=Sutcliffiella rhizosphaerae TaxID=2880967 RepID=A0ABM8YNC8_9BACI|nr:cell wall-binding repeat-containing protein [Sutcliffiella rhizosphaerae]CAG9621403.1 hypothetical protein BACCIP111883_02176 [Sutcliffiella rhizosphaerae]